MGRLTLNVLLSFAQFEREVTSERIRDKIAASKRKGLWVGGMAPQRPHVPHLNPRKCPQIAGYLSETGKHRFASDCVVGPRGLEPPTRPLYPDVSGAFFIVPHMVFQLSSRISSNAAR